MSKVSAKIESAAQTDSVTLIDNASNMSVELPLLHGAQPLRAAITGSTTSPGLFEVLEVLGREEVLRRIGNIPD